MDKKGDMQLSLNLIITLIIAVVFLGLAIFLVQMWLGNAKVIDIPGKCDFYPPTAEKPVCIASKLDLSRGKSYTAPFSFFNDGENELDASVAPNITCSPALALTVTVNPQKVPVGESRDYKMGIKVPKDAARQEYQCTVQMGEESQPVSVIVK